MKTVKRLGKTVLGIGVAYVAMAAWLPNTVKAAEEMKPMKGGEHL